MVQRGPHGHCTVCTRGPVALAHTIPKTVLAHAPRKCTEYISPPYAGQNMYDTRAPPLVQRRSPSHCVVNVAYSQRHAQPGSHNPNGIGARVSKSFPLQPSPWPPAPPPIGCKGAPPPRGNGQRWQASGCCLPGLHNLPLRPPHAPPPAPRPSPGAKR